MERHNIEAEVGTSVWVQCNGLVLTSYGRRILATGQKLTDQHVNYAQLQFLNLGAVNLVAVLLLRLQNQHTLAASHPLPWRSLNCCTHYKLCPWRGQGVCVSVHTTE